MTEHQEQLLDKYIEIRSCKIKREFTTRAEAKKEAKRMSVVKRNGKIKPYKYKHCPDFHIGHDKYENKPYKKNYGGTSGGRTHDILLKRQTL